LNNLDYQEGVKYHDGFYYSKDIAIIDITKLTFEDNTYDVILCNHVLEHIIDDHLAMSELYRILKPGGWAILQVPISMALEETYENAKITEVKDREEHFGQFDHVRIYGKDYTSKLEKAGFKVEAISPYSQWNESAMLNKYAVNKNETLFIAHK
jgi:predicted SAM-dependent methyltransferase